MGKLKVTDHHAELIEFLYVRGVTQSELARMFNLSLATIQRFADQSARERYRSKILELVRPELLELGVVPPSIYKEKPS